MSATVLAVCAAVAPVRADDAVGMRFDSIQRFSKAAANAPLPTPEPFAPAFARALARRDAFEKRSPRTILGLDADEFDVFGAGRPSTWFVRADGVTRVDYSYFGKRLTLIFDPHKHEIVYVDPKARTYRRYDTGPDDAFYATASPRPGSIPSPARSPEPKPKVRLVPGGGSTIDGVPVELYRAKAEQRSFATARVDYVSALPRPPVIPFPGFYQATSYLGIALGPAVDEPPNGLVLFRAVTFSQTAMAELFKHEPDYSARTTSVLVCMRGNVRPILRSEPDPFVPPSDYTRIGAVAPAPTFVFGRDSDDFIAFHDCDDVVAKDSRSSR